MINEKLEKLLSYYVQSRFLRPKIRPYKTNNYYAILMKGGMTDDSVLEKDRKKRQEKAAEACCAPDRPAVHPYAADV